MKALTVDIVNRETSLNSLPNSHLFVLYTEDTRT